MYSSTRCQLGAAALSLILSACVSRSPTEAYTQRFDACMSQLLRERPDMSTQERRKSCVDKVGPAPFDSPATVPAPVF